MSFHPKLLRFDSLSSTNSEAARQAQQGAPEGVTVVANEQTAGRGRLQRAWVSPAGAGLYFSIILRPPVAFSIWPVIPLLTALSVHDALVESCALKTDIKWPNDVMFDERKLCGILAETVETPAGRALIVGVGINLNSAAFPDDLREVATSIADATGSEIDREIVLQSLIKALAQRYAFFQADDGAARIIDDWSRHSSYANGKKVLVRSAKETFKGITCGLESDGALRVETDAGEIRIVRAGDVTNVRPD